MENKINWENSQKEQWFKTRTQVQARMQPSAYKTEGTMAAQESESAATEQGKTIMRLNEPSPDRASSDLVQPRWT